MSTYYVVTENGQRAYNTRQKAYEAGQRIALEKHQMAHIYRGKTLIFCYWWREITDVTTGGSHLQWCQIGGD